MPNSPNAPQNATSAQLCAFLAYMAQERRLADNSLATYRYSVHSYLAHLSGLGLGPGQATKEIFLAYLKHRKLQGRAAGTLFQDVLATRHFHRYLLREGIAKDDPTAGIRLTVLKNRLPQPLSRAEMEKLLEAPKGKRFQSVRDRAILELFYATGLRVSELLGLRTGQVDLTAGHLRVIGKRNKERLVPFGTRAEEAIRNYLVLRAERYPDATEPMFIGQHGRKMSRGHLWAQLKIYAKKAGIVGRVTPHILRHYADNRIMPSRMSIL